MAWILGAAERKARPWCCYARYMQVLAGGACAKHSRHKLLLTKCFSDVKARNSSVCWGVSCRMNGPCVMLFESSVVGVVMVCSRKELLLISLPCPG